MANVQILDAALTIDRYSGMGTTLVAALVRGNTLTVAHVGDSRLYLFGQRLRQLTSDDSWTATVLAADPDMRPAVLQEHPMRNALTSAVGVRTCTTVHVVEESLGGGERILLTTDGIHGVLDPLCVEQLLGEQGLPAVPHGLVAAALARGGVDDCTAVVAEYSAGF
jgi:protein phosphatase